MRTLLGSLVLLSLVSLASLASLAVFVNAVPLSALSSPHVGLLEVGAETEVTATAKLWKAWQTFHAKTYHSKAEQKHRAKIWNENKKFIEDHNKLGKPYTLGLNKFSDMTNEEYREYLQQSTPPPKNVCEKIKPPSQSMTKWDLPQKIDWRHYNIVTGVKDQKDCGSCYAFSAIAAIESAWKIGRGHLVAFSEQQIVDCSWAEENHGCGGGLMDFAFNYSIQVGLCTEDEYPYTATDGTCRESSCKKVGMVGRCVDIQVGDPIENEEMMEMIVGTQQPISVAVNAGGPIWQHYLSGVIDDPACTPLDNHGVAIVGYDTITSSGGSGSVNGTAYWIVKNSWGINWGVEGYVYVARGVNMCGIGTYPSYPVVYPL